MAGAIASTQAQEEWKWKVESAANTLMEAEKIKKDKKLLRAARAELKKKAAEATAAIAKT
jgi:hypothetical protein